MMKSAPTESKSAKAARLAEEAAVQRERDRAESNRIEDTQDLLDSATRRNVRRFGKMGGGQPSLLSLVNAQAGGAATGSGASLGTSGVIGSMLGGLSGTTVRGKGASSRSGGLTALV